MVTGTSESSHLYPQGEREGERGWGGGGNEYWDWFKCFETSKPPTKPHLLMLPEEFY